MRLRKLQFADESEYNSSKVCLDGTQKELIGEIMDWCGNMDHAQMALPTAVTGAGKSTIAHTITHSCPVPNSMSFSWAFSSGPWVLSIYGAVWWGLWLSGASPIIRHSHLFWRTGWAWQPLCLTSSSGSLYLKEASWTLSELLRDSVPKFPCCIKSFVTLWPVGAVDNYFPSSSSIHCMRIELPDLSTSQCATTACHSCCHQDLCCTPYWLVMINCMYKHS